METRLENEAALVETVLFLETEPMDEAALARATGLAKDIVEKALEILREEFAGAAHGLEPIRSGGGWILAPKPSHWNALKERYGRKSESRMSRAALETLSIVAYSQPITRAEVEALRGVSADGMIRFLLDKGFIKEVGKKDVPGRPVQYGTTKEFLKYFRLGSIADLPRLDELERDRFGDEGEDVPRLPQVVLGGARGLAAFEESDPAGESDPEGVSGASAPGAGPDAGPDAAPDAAPEAVPTPGDGEGADRG